VLQNCTLIFLNLTAYRCHRAGYRRAQGISLAQAPLDPGAEGMVVRRDSPIGKEPKGTKCCQLHLKASFPEKHNPELERK